MRLLDSLSFQKLASSTSLGESTKKQVQDPTVEAKFKKEAATKLQYANVSAARQRILGVDRSNKPKQDFSKTIQSIKTFASTNNCDSFQPLHGFNRSENNLKDKKNDLKDLSSQLPQINGETIFYETTSLGLMTTKWSFTKLDEGIFLAQEIKCRHALHGEINVDNPRIRILIDIPPNMLNSLPRAVKNSLPKAVKNGLKEGKLIKIANLN